MPSEPILSLPHDANHKPRGQRSGGGSTRERPTGCSFKLDGFLQGEVEGGLAVVPFLSSILGQLRGNADVRNPWGCAGALTCREGHALSVQQNLHFKGIVHILKKMLALFNLPSFQNHTILLFFLPQKVKKIYNRTHFHLSSNFVRVTD